MQESPTLAEDVALQMNDDGIGVENDDNVNQIPQSAELREEQPLQAPEPPSAISSSTSAPFIPRMNVKQLRTAMDTRSEEKRFMLIGGGDDQCHLFTTVADLCAHISKRENRTGFFWVDAFKPSPEDMQKLEHIFRLHPLTTEDILTGDSGEKWESFDRYLFVILNGQKLPPKKAGDDKPEQQFVKIDDKEEVLVDSAKEAQKEQDDEMFDWSSVEENSTPINIVVFSKFVLTVHKEPIRSLELILNRIEKECEVPELPAGHSFSLGDESDSDLDVEPYEAVKPQKEKNIHFAHLSSSSSASASSGSSSASSSAPYAAAEEEPVHFNSFSPSSMQPPPPFTPSSAHLSSGSVFRHRKRGPSMMMSASAAAAAAVGIRPSITPIQIHPLPPSSSSSSLLNTPLTPNPLPPSSLAASASGHIPSSESIRDLSDYDEFAASRKSSLIHSQSIAAALGENNNIAPSVDGIPPLPYGSNLQQQQRSSSFHFHGGHNAHHHHASASLITAIRTKIPSPDWIMYAFMDAITDMYIPVVDLVVSEVDSLDELVFLLDQSEQSDLLRRIGNARRALTALRRLLWPKQKLATYILSRETTPHFLHRVVQVYLRDVLDHLMTCAEKIETSRESLNQAHSLYVSRVSLQVSKASNDINESMKKLAIIASVVAPLTFISGLYGMNIPLPGQKDIAGADLPPFFILLGIMCAIASSMIYIFKKSMEPS